MNQLRLALSVAGLALAALSVALDDQRLGWGAIALLAASLIIRLVQRHSGTGKPDAEG